MYWSKKLYKDIWISASASQTYNLGSVPAHQNWLLMVVPSVHVGFHGGGQAHLSIGWLFWALTISVDFMPRS